MQVSWSGRCPHCGGNLYWDIDVQLLGSCYLQCLQCSREYTSARVAVARYPLREIRYEAREGRRFPVPAAEAVMV